MVFFEENTLPFPSFKIEGGRFMKRIIYFALGVCVLGLSVTEAREWTSRDGKTIEAELVCLKGEAVVLKVKGREVVVPFDKLSEEDVEYAKAESAEGGTEEKPAPGVIKIAGHELTPGVKSTFVVDFNEEEKKMVKEPGEFPLQARLTFLLHPDFAPAKENKIFFARTTHDGKNESGDMRAMGLFEEAARKNGWHLAVFDSPKGCIVGSALDTATFAAGLRVMEETWPGCSQKWKFGAGGVSGGAKSSQNLIAVMARNKVKPYALFLSGCNHFMGENFRKYYKVGPNVFANVRVFISNGLKDDISTIEHAEKVYDRMKKEGRVKNLRFDKYEGGHAPSPEQVETAFKWFDDPAGKK